MSLLFDASSFELLSASFWDIQSLPCGLLQGDTAREAGVQFFRVQGFGNFAVLGLRVLGFRFLEMRTDISLLFPACPEFLLTLGSLQTVDFGVSSNFGLRGLFKYRTGHPFYQKRW